MKKILSITSAMLLLLSMGACRPESDTLVSYAHNDKLVFASADSSFAAKFQIMWNGLNQYYSIWDYEAHHGVDWDAIYDEYYPQFEALDKASTVTDDELKTLMQKTLGPLHDGHFSFDMKNHKTGNTVSYSPALDRFASRDDYAIANGFKPDLTYYADVAHGQVETDAEGNPIVMSYSTSALDMILRFLSTPGIGLQWTRSRIQELAALPIRTEMENFQLQQLQAFYQELSTIGGLLLDAAVTLYNRLHEKYGFLEIPGYDYIDPIFVTKGITFDYALFKGNIAYFHVNSFAMTLYLEDARTQETFNTSDPATMHHIQQMREVWQAWFNTVQQLHRSGRFPVALRRPSLWLPALQAWHRPLRLLPDDGGHCCHHEHAPRDHHRTRRHPHQRQVRQHVRDVHPGRQDHAQWQGHRQAHLGRPLPAVRERVQHLQLLRTYRRKGQDGRLWLCAHARCLHLGQKAD